MSFDKLVCVASPPGCGGHHSPIQTPCCAPPCSPDVTFLSSQYWSRLSSCLRSADASTLFAPILGVTSLFSTVSAALAVAKLAAHSPTAPTPSQVAGVCVESVAVSYGELASVHVGMVTLLLSLPLSHVAYVCLACMHTPLHCPLTSDATPPFQPQVHGVFISRRWQPQPRHNCGAQIECTATKGQRQPTHEHEYEHGAAAAVASTAKQQPCGH